MFPFATVADQILRTATGVVRSGEFAQFAVLDLLPVAIYVTDADGFISYFNPACVVFAGHEPTVGRDRWCVSWKIYTDDGRLLPHDQCPMAVAIQTRQAIRGATAVAERPDGSRVNFLPFPTPVTDANDQLLGAVNMLIDITDGQKRLSRYLSNDTRPFNDRLVAEALATFSVEDLARLVAEIEMELGQQGPRMLN